MSGNPFRRPQVDTQQVGDRSAPKKRVKKVQFVSPVASPSEPPSHPRFPSLEELDDGPKSPPPKGSDFGSIDIQALLRGDHTAGGTIDLDANAKLYDASAATTAANTPISPTPAHFQLEQPPPGRRGPPPNPFARTLANIESVSPSERGEQEGKKAALDVDAFKRLLLTGKADAITTEPDSRKETTQPEAINRVTPRLDPASGQEGPEGLSSPLSSLEDASSESESSLDEGEGQTKSTTSTSASSSAVDSKGTRDASFDDFEGLEPSVEETGQSGSRIENLSRERSESDLNKPLPYPPNQSQIGLEMPQSPAPASGASASAKKPTQAPPPPPTARRRGPVAAQSRSRSSSDADVTAPATQTELTSTAKPKPPPPRAPPSRHSSKETNRLSDQLRHSRTPSTSSVVPEEAPEVSPADIQAPAKLKPPPPPSRSSSKQASHNLQRTPSSSSSISQRRPSPATGGAAAPPPPPRPRRGEGRSTGVATGQAETTDAHRLSGASFDSHRRDSVSSLRRVAEQSTGSETKTSSDARPPMDMLADLDAFQREVDALRAKALAGK